MSGSAHLAPMGPAERFSRFFARRRHAFAAVIGLLTVFFAVGITRLEVVTQFVDLLPRDHPYIETYERYREVYGNANVIVVALVARDGDIYQSEVLRAVREATERVGSSVLDDQAHAHPESHFVTPRGPVAGVVHTLVSWIDRWLYAPSEERPLTGVDQDLVSSLTHRTARDTRVRIDGTLYATPLVEAIPETPAELEELRTRVRRTPSVLGVMVSLDERAALVRANYIESRIDYGALFKHLQAMKRDLEAEYPVDVHVTGQPMLFGWAYAFATEILLVFGMTVLVSVVLLWAYFRRFLGIFLPLSGAAVNTVWGLGFAGWCGFHLDPLVLVVPMLITARAISHSVQFVERFYEEYEALGDKEEACVRSMAELLLPGTLAIATDCVGLLTISLATIPLIHDLGLLSAFWAVSIAVTEMLLNRLLILYLPPPRDRRHYVPAWTSGFLARASSLVASRRGAMAVVGVFALGAAVSAPLAWNVPIGDNRPGSPLLYPDSEFNAAAREIATRFFGSDDLLVIAHSDEPQAVYTPRALAVVESLQRVLETDADVGGSVSVVDLMSQTSQVLHNNDPRWAMRMQTPAEILALDFFMWANSPAPGIMDSYRARDGRSLAVRAFYRDHRSETVADATDLLERFAESERLDGSLAIRLEPRPAAWRRALAWIEPLLPPQRHALVVTEPDADGGRRALEVLAPRAETRDGARVLGRFEGPDGLVAEHRRSGLWGEDELYIQRRPEDPFELQPSGTWLRDGIELRRAAGTVGVLAAVNRELESSHRLGLLIALFATFSIVVASYRSIRMGLLLFTSLGVAALAALATQSLLGIGVNVNTLPVQAIGIGIGVDYAIYIVDRIVCERERGLGHVEAIERGIRTTGLAIAFTASTLIAGIVFWIPISSLRFQAEMSFLLSILMLVNALGAVLLVPALLRLLPQRS